MKPIASILIPTWNSPMTLSYAIMSAQNQTISEIEILIVGDGVGSKTLDVITSFAGSDPRIRFFNFDKGENRGERNRHFGVLEANSNSIIYLADDDILMPQHVANILEILQVAPFVQSRNTYFDHDFNLQVFPTDLSDPKLVAWHLVDPPRNRVSITGTAHTKDLYLQLERGWDLTPKGMGTDLFLWKQFFRLPNFKGATHNQVSALQFPASIREEKSYKEMKEIYEKWYEFSQSESGFQELQIMADESARATLNSLSAEMSDLHAEIQRLNQEIANRDNLIIDAKAQLATLIKTVEQIKNSLSWRITSPLRKLKNMGKTKPPR